MKKKKNDDTDSDDNGVNKTKNDEKYELAEKLSHKIKADPSYAIESEIFYDKHITNYEANKGLEEKQRIAGIIMHKTNLDDLVKLTIRHYRNQRKVKEGNRQAREL